MRRRRINGAAGTTPKAGAARKKRKTEEEPETATERNRELASGERLALCSRCYRDLGPGAAAYGLTSGEIDDVFGRFLPSMFDEWQLFCERCMGEIGRSIWG